MTTSPSRRAISVSSPSSARAARTFLPDHSNSDVIEITEAMSGHEAPRFPGDVAGVDQLAEDSLQLPAADLERACDMFEPNVPLVRTRQQITKHTLGLDREPRVDEYR